MSTRAEAEPETARQADAPQREGSGSAPRARLEDADEHFDGLLLNESARTRDWNTPEEEVARAWLPPVMCC